MRSVKWVHISGIMLCLMMQPISFAQGFFDDIELTDEAFEELYSHPRDELFDLALQMETQATPVPTAGAETPAPAGETASADAPKSEEPKTEESKSESPKAESSESAPTAEASTPAPEAERIGIDTAELTNPAGNWLYKRIWWERAQNRYEQIKGVFDQILELRMPFSRRRAEVDRKVLEPFYINLGLNQAEIVEILTTLNTLLELEQEKNKTLDERDRGLLDKVQEDKKILEQLQKDVQALGKYDDALDDALDKLMEQVNAARNYEKQAWNTYKDIGKELNDKRARELYYSMDTHFKNITNVAQYVQGAFKQHFDTVDRAIQDQTVRIKEVFQALKEKGVNLKDYIKQLDAKLQKDDEPKEEEAEEPQPEEGGIMHTLGSWWQAAIDSLYSALQYVISFIPGMGSDESATTDEATDK